MILLLECGVYPVWSYCFDLLYMPDLGIVLHTISVLQNVYIMT